MSALRHVLRSSCVHRSFNTKRSLDLATQRFDSCVRSPVSARAAAADVDTVKPGSQDGARPAFQRRKRIAQIKSSDKLVGQEIEVRGWVRTVRDQKSFAFLEVNDGSSMSGLQVVVSDGADGYDLVGGGHITTGASVAARGELVESPGGKQSVELKASALKLIGSCDAKGYPLQKKRHTLEFLRGIAHLRPRTNTIGAVMRVRAALAQATHSFFRDQGFLYVHTPIISASDCEGAGEMFQVTTLLSRLERSGGDLSAASSEDLKVAIKEQGEIVKAAKEDAKAASNEKAAQESVDVLVSKLLQLKDELKSVEEAENASQIPLNQAGEVDYEQDFFGRKAYLTVSGQLNGEMYACAMGDIYTFGPTFRAENSNTTRHLAEFWMIEPEMAFADLQDNMDCAEAYLKHCLGYVIQHCEEDLRFFDARISKGLLERLQNIVDTPFARITYTEAVERLESSGKSFQFPVSWGIDLQTEHERYLTEVEFEGTPVMVTDYPKDIKAFYMRLNDDDRTVAAVDMLVPGVGELVGGSQREDRMDILEARMKEAGLEPMDYGPYLDLRRYGSVPHAGFGLGFERLVQFATGMENIRDVVPFPRYPDHAEY